MSHFILRPLRLGYRPPYDFAGILSFLRMRAIPGVEQVSDSTYARSFCIAGTYGDLSVSQDVDSRSLQVRVKVENTRLLRSVSDRVISLFDLNADPTEICRHLRTDKLLAPLVDENPGQRVPGCWEPFEIAIRAIVGQQVSVKSATRVMGRIVAAYGSETERGLYFPSPEALSRLEITSLPMPGSRAQTIKDFSLEIANGNLTLDRLMQPDELVKSLVAIKGIGNWTAQYVAMRAISDPDAFLAGDLVLMRVARQLGLQTDAELESRAEQWRPWRAYAGMHLWRQAAPQHN